jgi:hypothetical protein
MLVHEAPTGKYTRRIWFLYEWLLGRTLDIPALVQGTYESVVDPKQQWVTSEGKRIPRQRVIHNLPGTPRFCPLVYRTGTIEAFVQANLKQKAKEVMGRIPRDLIARTASFLLLKDSRASYIIEGETPPQNRIQRWGRIISDAGKEPLSFEELVRLQKIVIGDTRFVHVGLRNEGGFIGEHDRETGMPIPEHISARPEDLFDLVQGLIEFDTVTEGKLDPVIKAALLSFGFVYIHPFSDGNGRIHRFLIHHVLAKSGYNPPGLVFPVSAVMLDRIEEYRSVLQTYSSRVLPHIIWETSPDKNVRVLNNTDDYYRFFDATPQVEFLFSCVKQTVDVDLPEETRLLQVYDEFKTNVELIIDMSSKTIDLLFRFLRQNKGKLSRRACEKEFAKLRDDEIDTIEKIYREVMR